MFSALYIIIAIVIAFAVGVYQQLKRRQRHQGSLEEDDVDYVPAFIAGCLWPITISYIFVWLMYLGYVKLVKYLSAKIETELENLHYKSKCDTKSKC